MSKILSQNIDEYLYILMGLVFKNLKSKAEVTRKIWITLSILKCKAIL